MHPNAGLEILKDNLRSTYFRSPKGLLFAIVPPAGLALFFTAPQGLYVWYNTAAWLLFATLVLSTANVLTGNRTVFERYPIAVHSFLYFPVMRAFLNFSIAYFVLAGLLWKAGFPPSYQELAFGWLLALPLGSLGLGIGLVLSVAHYLYRWRISAPLALISLLIFWEIHPLSSLIAFPSKAFLNDDLTEARTYVLSAASSVLFLALSFRFFWIAKKGLFEKCL
jgi:ABC-type polysaccharide/polyol phosphate export permease